MPIEDFTAHPAPGGPTCRVDCRVSAVDWAWRQRPRLLLPVDVAKNLSSDRPRIETLCSSTARPDTSPGNSESGCVWLRLTAKLLTRR